MLPRAAIGFLPEYLDFRKGIRVGNLEDNQRITHILKLAIEDAFQESFVTERYGRGVYWKWIGFVMRANRSAKPISSNISFGCSKFFIAMDADDRIFKCGFSVERGYLKAPPEFAQCELKPDWDWNRLVKQLKPDNRLYLELKRLVKREGFSLDGGNWEELSTFQKNNFPGPDKLRKILKESPGDSWSGFQVYYSMNEKDVADSSGVDLIESMMAIFREVTPAMNACMQVQLREKSKV